ncbi:MAG: hypothetical protein KF761_14095 [Salinibacterium sp.]|nr:hypothetical protein [Salinibacterium sp.]
MPSFTRTRRRLPAAAAALAIVASLAFAAPAQADEIDPSTVTEEVVTPVDPTVVVPKDDAPADDTTADDETPADDQTKDETPTDDPTKDETPADDTSDTEKSDTQEEPDASQGSLRLASFSAPAALTAVPAAVACVPIAGWTPEDLAPVETVNGLVFDGPQVQAVNYFQRVSAGNAQGLTGMSYTVAPGATGYAARMVVEVDPNANLGSGTIHYATLSLIDQAASGTIDAQNGLWYTTKIGYSSPGGMGNPLSWDALIALMPNNTLLSAPSLALQSASTPTSHSIVTSITSSCGSTDFTTPAPVVETCAPANVVPVTISSPSQLFYDIRLGGSSSVTAKGLELAWSAAAGGLSQSKSAWYYATDFPLYKLGSPTIDYESLTGASVGENYAISVDGVLKGYIVKEPGIANYWTNFSIPGMSADPSASYRKAIGTIQDFVNAYWLDDMTHDVRVVAIGGSGGSGSEGTGILHGQKAGCYSLTYGIPPVVTPPATTPGGTTAAAGTAIVTPTVTPTPTATPTAAPSASPTPEPSASPSDLPTEALPVDTTSNGVLWWPWAVGLGILVLLGGLWFLFFRRRRSSEN